MSVSRPSSALLAAAILAAAACGDPTDPAPLGGNAVLRSGVLSVQGDDGPNTIVILFSTAGVDVERDGESARFTDPVTAIQVSAGAGGDVVRYDQTVVADVALTVDSGDGDDRVEAAFAPAGSGTAMTVVADLRVGAGADRLDFRWDGSAVPTLNPWIRLTGETQGGVQAVPEVDDEVLVTFEHGDPDRPVVIGMVWNAGGTSEPPAGADTRRLDLELDFRAGTADAAIAIAGGFGRDSTDLSADYSGVLLQQGRVSVDADLGEGGNHVSTHIFTSRAHTYVDVRIAAGAGNDVVELEDVLGGDGERSYAIELGDGDNQTAIGFGDGIRGARPSTGTRNVTGSYRSGAGTSSVILDSEIVEPLVSDFTIDYGPGQGDTYGRYKVKLPWEPASSPGTQPAPSQIKVVVLSPMGSALDLRADVGDPDVDDPAAFGVVTATGSQVRETDFQFIQRLAQDAASGAIEQEWEVAAAGLATAGSGAIGVDAPGLERLVYLQDAVQLPQGASLDVALAGGDGTAILAHLIGITGPGRYDFLADGGAGGELLAVLTRDLDAAGGAGMAFNLAGGDGDDVLGLDRPAITPGTPIAHTAAGGTGTDACFMPQEVAVTGCERLEPIGQELLGLIETTFGATLADVWRQP